MFQDITMGKAKDLTVDERKLITQKLGQGISKAQIAREMNRDIRTIQKATQDIFLKEKHDLTKVIVSFQSEIKENYVKL